MRREKGRICVVAPVHIWDDVRVFQKEARSLAEVGWEVCLIAQAPSEMVVDGVRIIPANAPKSPRWRRFTCLPLVLRQALRLRADVYHFHNPDTIPLALFLKSFGRRVIYDTHEDFVKRIQIRDWVPKPLRSLVGWAVGAGERMIGRLADAAIGTQEDVVRRLGDRAILIGNPPRFTAELLEEVDHLAADIKDKFDGLRAIYIGGVSESRGLFDMVNALALANQEMPVRLWLIGPANNDDLNIAKSLAGWRFVDFHDRMPQVRAFSYVTRADVGLITIQDVGDHATTDPNKIYEYMVFGVPFIASDFPAWRKKFDRVLAGRFVQPGDPTSLARELVAMAQDPSDRIKMGSRGQAYVAERHWGHEAKKLIKVYESMI